MEKVKQKPLKNSTLLRFIAGVFRAAASQKNLDNSRRKATVETEKTFWGSMLTNVWFDNGMFG